MQFPVTLTDDERAVVKYLGSHESRQLLTDEQVCAYQCGLSLDAARSALRSLQAKGAIKWTTPTKNTAGKVFVPGRWDLTTDGRVLVL